MTSNANANATQTPGTAHLSPVSSTLIVSPAWAPPKSPLSPHRLAKLANALGVSTPLPAVHQSTSLMTRTYLESPTPTSEAFRRSPTPSTPGTNFSSYTTTVSKYLLHVIPPLHLPHDTDDNDMTPPPPTASGYHTQFRRGTLVPVHSTLQSQLVAIAKEYALPSTTGLILFLVASPKSPQPGISPENMVDELDEPGPRLSEDIWKHLWTRVLKVEQRDDTLMPPSLRSPLGMTLGTQSTPYLPNETNVRPLRPLLSSTSDANAPNFSSNPFPPSPTTPSTVSNSRSAPPSESSACEPETPDTSSAAPSILKDPETRGNSLDLPGLMSPSVIPILAKVEFDIDRKRAAWYEPWLRSRKLNHAKRAGRNVKQSSRENSGDNLDGSQDPRHIGLLIGNKEAQSTLSLSLSLTDGSSVHESESNLLATSYGYEQLEEEEEEGDGEVGEEEEEEEEKEEEEEEEEEEAEEEPGGGWSDDSDDDFESTARVATLTLENHKDALADIFGTDAETWAALKASSPRNSKRETNPNVVELALDAADLTALPSPTESELEHLGKEEDEVQALLDQMSRPSAPSESRPASPVPANKKHVPPPLTLITSPPSYELTIPAVPSPASASSAGLAYLDESLSSGIQNEQDEMMDFEMDYTRMKSPSETEKREGAVFDDLDLGLDPAEDYDDSDPHDRRRSQFLMKAQLDEIERTMAQLSPRILQSDLADEQPYQPFLPHNSMTLSPGSLNADHYPPSPRLPSHPEVPDSPASQPQAAWPATPFSSLKDTPSQQRSDGPPSPPRLAVNGISTSAPKSFKPISSGGVSAESESRRREHEAEQGYRPHPSTEKALDSPIIPLSPDPFGRFVSTSPSPGLQTSAYWENDTLPGLPAVDSPAALSGPETRTRSSPATSRFSADSITGVEVNAKPNRATLTVNTFKKLWRKSTKSSAQPPTPSSTSFPPVPSVPAVPPVPASRPSREQSDEPPKTPIFGGFSPQPATPLRPPDASLQAPTQLSVSVTPRRSQDAPSPVPQALSVPVTPQRPMPQLQPQPQSQSQSQHPSALTPSASPLHQQRPPIPQSQYPPGSQQRSPMPYAISPSPPPAAISQQFAPPPLFNGRNNYAQPIVAAQMRPGRSNSTMAYFEFDQESPYPITRRPTTSSNASSPPPAPSPKLQTAQLPPPTTPAMTNGNLPSPMAAPTASQQEKSGARKSILKGWKSSSVSSVSSQQTATAAEPRSSFERPNGNATRTKRPNVLNVGSSRGSASSPLPDIPPSPQIPQQFIGQNHNRQSIASKLTKSSIDSTHSATQLSKQLSVGSASSARRSMASSRSSQDSRPSFDASQFEMVSPKMGSALTYPSHSLDHSMDHSSVEGN